MAAVPAFAALVLVVFAQIGRVPEVRDGAVRMSYPLAMKAFAWFAALLFFVVSAAILREALQDDPNPRAVRLAWFGVPLMTALGTIMLCEIRVVLAADGQGIRGRTAFRGHRELRWQDVVEVQYWPTAQWLLLRDDRGETLRVPRFVRGFLMLPLLMQASLRPEVLQRATAELSRWH